MSRSEKRRLELTDELLQWEVVLVSGHVVLVAAHGYGEDADEYTFSALMDGTPRFEVHVATFPRAAIRRILTR